MAVACGASAEALVAIGDVRPFGGVGLVVGGAVIALVTLPMVAALLRRPASTLATALWIP